MKARRITSGARLLESTPLRGDPLSALDVSERDEEGFVRSDRVREPRRFGGASSTRPTSPICVLGRRFAPWRTSSSSPYGFSAS